MLRNTFAALLSAAVLLALLPPAGAQEEKQPPVPEEKKDPAPPPAPEKIKVPDVRNKTLDEAKAELEKAGLVLGASSDAPGLGKPGLVFTQAPAPGTSVEKGSKVNLKIGASPLQVEIPDVVGLKEALARAKLIAAKLKVGEVTQKILEGKGGEVVEQTPAGARRSIRVPA